MVKIAVCDDEPVLAEQLSKRIKRLAADSEVFVFERGSDLLQADVVWDIAFLDIQMDEMHGFQVARHLREKHPNCLFSFITAYKEFAVEGYDYQPFRYILKDAPGPVIDRKIKENIEEYRARNSFLEITYKGKTSIVYVNQIKWMEIDGHCLKIHTNDDIILWGRSLEEVEQELKKDYLIRCHRSYIVALPQVKRLKANEAILENGMAVSIGRLYKNFVKESYKKYKETRR